VGHAYRVSARREKSPGNSPPLVPCSPPSADPSIERLFQTKRHYNGDVWLGFDRLTCVPIQTKMVQESMLSKEEKQWLKVRLFACPTSHWLYGIHPTRRD